jgi:hypothetical protein
MKKLTLLILLSTIIFCGCEFSLDYENAVIFFSPRPISKETFDPEQVQNTFEQGQTIYYGIYSKEPFKANEGRMQILRKDPNTQLYGYAMVLGKDILLSPEKNYYTDSFTIFTEGYYLMRVFSKNNPDVPLAQKTFWISQ